MRSLFCVLCCFFVCLQVAAQTAPPSTDIYVVGFEEGQIILSEDGPQNLTDRDGYDNQPFFSEEGTHLLYTSSREGQTDIYKARLSDGEIEQVTDTPESEYSPTLTFDGGLSVIRVEADGTQRLWRFDRDGKNPSLLFTNIKPVGYHAWIDKGHVAMFILGDPPTLQVGALSSGEAVVSAEAIGRSLHRIPGTEYISFVHKRSDSEWQIRRLDPHSGTITDIAPTLAGREDYAWTPDGTVLMADGAELYRWDADTGHWTSLYDFAMHGITHITRLAISPKGNTIAFVASK